MRATEPTAETRGWFCAARQRPRCPTPRRGNNGLFTGDRLYVRPSGPASIPEAFRVAIWATPRRLGQPPANAETADVMPRRRFLSEKPAFPKPIRAGGPFVLGWEPRLARRNAPDKYGLSDSPLKNLGREATGVQVMERGIPQRRGIPGVREPRRCMGSPRLEMRDGRTGQPPRRAVSLSPGRLDAAGKERFLIWPAFAVAWLRCARPTRLGAASQFAPACRTVPERVCWLWDSFHVSDSGSL